MMSFQEALADALVSLKEVEAEEEQEKYIAENTTVFDQMDAAALENAEYLKSITQNAANKGLHVDKDIPVSLMCRAYVMAGFRRTTKKCEHVMALPYQPLFIILPMRLRACVECYDLLTPPRIAEMAEVDDDRCDLCEEPATFFRPMLLSLAQINLAGDVCDRCWEVLKGSDGH